jgi:uncharacterized protein YjbJ (UPF0337 family)
MNAVPRAEGCRHKQTHADTTCLQRKGTAVSTADKANNKAEEVKGKVKETTGKAVGNERLEAEGAADQTKGNVKQAGEKIKDAAKALKP